MPKINIVNKEQMNEETSFVQNSDPKTWAWTYPANLKQIKDLHFACDYNHSDGVIKYGLFKDKKLTNPVSGMELEVIHGMPVIQMVSTVESERRKGYASLIYENALNRHSVLISGDELYTDENETNRSLGMWVNYLPTIGVVGNYNIDTNEISKFNLKEAYDKKNIRFIVMNESFRGLKNGILTGALGLTLAGIPSGSDDHKTKLTVPSNPTPSSVSLQKDVSHKEPEKATPIISSHKLNDFINMSIITKIESNDNPNAVSPAGAKGLCQIMPKTWAEETKTMFGKSLPEDKIFDGEINKKVGNHYYNVTLPKYLKAFNIPINTETILASYNYGIKHIQKLYEQYGVDWSLHLPKETKHYIQKYKALEKQ
jgi:hypothetical protein